MVEESKKRRGGTPSTTADSANQSPVKFTDPEKKAGELNKILDDEAAFEDPYGDEFEEEDMVYNDDENVEGDAVMNGEDETVSVRPWRPGIDPIEDEEELDYDPGVYDMYHHAMLGWSCLSFDIMPDTLGSGRDTYPHEAMLVAGTQADKLDGNRLYVMRWKNLTKTKHKADDDSDDSDSEDEDDPVDEPILDFRVLQHPGTVNRVRCCPQLPRLVASWSASGKVHMWDLKEHLEGLDQPGSVPNPKHESKFIFSGHADEGYAMAFNPLKTGMFASGSCDSTIRIWNPVEAGWAVGKPIKSHVASVEDLQWKRSGNGAGDVVASCSVDKTIRLFDLKASNKAQIVIAEAHKSDVNVISWSPFQDDFILSGGDEGSSKVWDLRNVGEPIVDLRYHHEPISSVDWHPTDPAMFATSSLDNSVTLWDMSVEPDEQPGQASAVVADSPDQLMFQHMGQNHITEIQWHPQIPGVLITTAEDGFNVFKTFNI